MIPSFINKFWALKGAVKEVIGPEEATPAKKQTEIIQPQMQKTLNALERAKTALKKGKR
ncbi:MAG: hypothetical protein JRI57_00310 [Deltaproteobacteria bacterium]|nr:hypothetical protein [Deltaproteobacteria bacterium]MBW1951513.1 hypothetical protein [Deltaproteobacteria bacterium]